MPLLPLEPTLHPEGILDLPIDDEARWLVLHTRPHAEKALARRLRHQEIAFFLPLYKKVSRVRGRVQRSFLPLFPGYLFLRGGHDDKLKSLETNLVVNALNVADQEQLRWDLQRVHRAMQSDAPLAPENLAAPGTPVEIVSGPLSGMVGQVIRRGDSFRFVIDVKILQQSIALEMEQQMFRPMTERPAASQVYAY